MHLLERESLFERAQLTCHYWFKSNTYLLTGDTFTWTDDHQVHWRRHISIAGPQYEIFPRWLVGGPNRPEKHEHAIRFPVKSILDGTDHYVYAFISWLCAFWVRKFTVIGCHDKEYRPWILYLAWMDNRLTHWGQVTHIYVGELYQGCFGTQPFSKTVLIIS